MNDTQLDGNTLGENLDGFASISDLANHISKAKRAGYPAEYIAYAQEKGKAMSARLQGRIGDALRHESNCDKSYAAMPADWRW